MSQNTSDPVRLEKDLDQTRSRLGGHLKELQDKLSPGQVLDEVVGYFRGSEGAAFGRSLMTNIRGNPIPAAITGIGLVWLMASGARAGSSEATAPASEWKTRGIPDGPHLYGRDDYSATVKRVRDAEQRISRNPAEGEQAYSLRLNDIRGRAIGLARHEQETPASFGERVRDALAAAEQMISKSVGNLGSQLGDAMHAAGGAVSAAGISAQDMARDATRSMSGTLSQGGKVTSRAGGHAIAAITDSPVLLGALGLAAGALLGAFLPQSEQEETALGGVASRARNTATGLAKEGLERGGAVTQAVLAKGRESAQAHGLTGRSAGEVVDAALSGDLADSVKTAIHDVLQTGDEAIRTAVAPSEAKQAEQVEQPARSAT